MQTFTCDVKCFYQKQKCKVFLERHSSISCFWLQVGGTQEGPIGTAESVLTEDGADVPASDNMVLRKLLVSASCQLNF